MGLMDLFKSKLANSSRAATARRVSTDYQVVERESVETVQRALRGSWQDTQIPVKQRQIVDPQLDAYHRGASVPVFDALVDIMRGNIDGLQGARVLEVGCSSGYYSEVLAIKGLEVQYEGCDYSPSFIELARQKYPDIPFKVQDATKLDYASGSFDIVISGGCILHIPEYEAAIAEAARVSRRWVVFHRTPVLHIQGPIMYTKKAYGIDTLEIHFNEQALLHVFSKHGMRVMDINTHSIGWQSDKSDALAMKTYLCEKVAHHG
jgi:ubiquinone/menaquinone biosynthesis C-methylase UbiE